jgi:hypothetical protein
MMLSGYRAKRYFLSLDVLLGKLNYTTGYSDKFLNYGPVLPNNFGKNIVLVLYFVATVMKSRILNGKIRYGVA